MSNDLRDLFLILGVALTATILVVAAAVQFDWLLP